ncbi:hypothetical protein [Candidatus Albibeggiatoa sp. nov. BB20]|uniref:hypothetical protein n=1 Tax=Candidatus Albibeggiatoa sp. nov. BB20 TaxID=3162723 RepID=UPI003365407B
MDLPHYINEGVGLPMFQGPYMQEDSKLAVFAFKADKAKLKAICDKYLNSISSDEYHYTPLLSYVTMVYADMTIYSLHEKEINIGKLHETDLAIWIPILVKKKVAGVYLPSHITYFLPYLFVDNPYAIATGREVYGFRKIHSIFQFSGDITNPEFTVNNLVFKQFGADSRAEWDWVMKMQRVESNIHDKTAWNSAEEMYDYVMQQLKQQNDALSLDEKDEKQTKSLFNFKLSMPLIFLKQFPDIKNSEYACYQKLVQANVTITRFKRAARLAHKYKLHINELESHPIIQQLGLKAESNVVTPSAAFWVNMDFSMDFGKEL